MSKSSQIAMALVGKLSLSQTYKEHDMQGWVGVEMADHAETEVCCNDSEVHR